MTSVFAIMGKWCELFEEVELVPTRWAPEEVGVQKIGLDRLGVSEPSGIPKSPIVRWGHLWRLSTRSAVIAAAGLRALKVVTGASDLRSLFEFHHIDVALLVERAFEWAQKVEHEYFKPPMRVVLRGYEIAQKYLEQVRGKEFLALIKTALIESRFRILRTQLEKASEVQKKEAYRVSLWWPEAGRLIERGLPYDPAFIDLLTYNGERGEKAKEAFFKWAEEEFLPRWREVKGRIISLSAPENREPWEAAMDCYKRLYLIWAAYAPAQTWELRPGGKVYFNYGNRAVLGIKFEGPVIEGLNTWASMNNVCLPTLETLEASTELLAELPLTSEGMEREWKRRVLPAFEGLEEDDFEAHTRAVKRLWKTARWLPVEPYKPTRFWRCGHGSGVYIL